VLEAAIGGTPHFFVNLLVTTFVGIPRRIEFVKHTIRHLGPESHWLTRCVVCQQSFPLSLTEAFAQIRARSLSRLIWTLRFASSCISTPPASLIYPRIPLTSPRSQHVPFLADKHFSPPPRKSPALAYALAIARALHRE
jgi:hypothetical protein